MTIKWELHILDSCVLVPDKCTSWKQGIICENMEKWEVKVRLWLQLF